jgi:hypothetical protein
MFSSPGTYNNTCETLLEDAAYVTVNNQGKLILPMVYDRTMSTIPSFDQVGQFHVPSRPHQP